MTIKQQGGVFGRNPTFNNVEVEGSLTVDGSAVPDPSDILVSSDIGSTVQGYDADTAKLDVAQTFTADQTFDQAKATNFILDAVVASNYDIKMVSVNGDGGTNTVQVFWNSRNPSGVAAAGGVLGAYDRSGNYAAPTDVIGGSSSWTIYGFIGVAP